MSRNLCRVNCVFCEGDVRPSEAPRPITADEAGVYFSEYEGMLVARAACVYCEAPYLAWIDERRRVKGARNDYAAVGQSHLDLSHYHSFNDEPALEDLPRWRIEVVRQRRPAPRCYWCDALVHNGHCFDHTCPSRRLPSP